MDEKLYISLPTPHSTSLRGPRAQPPQASAATVSWLPQETPGASPPVPVDVELLLVEPTRGACSNPQTSPVTENCSLNWHHQLSSHLSANSTSSAGATKSQEEQRNKGPTHLCTFHHFLAGGHGERGRTGFKLSGVSEDKYIAQKSPSVPGEFSGRACGGGGRQPLGYDPAQQGRWSQLRGCGGARGRDTHVLLKTPPRALPSRRQSCCEKKTQEIWGSELCVWQRRSSSVGPRKAMHRPKLKKTLQ